MRPAGPAPFPPSARIPGPPPAAPPEKAKAAEPEWAALQTPEVSLWELLTPEERAVFAQHAALGTLTYGLDGRPAAASALPTGSRIDVKG